MDVTCPTCSKNVTVTNEAKFCPLCGNPLAGRTVEVRETARSRYSRLKELARVFLDKYYHHQQYGGPHHPELREHGASLYVQSVDTSHEHGSGQIYYYGVCAITRLHTSEAQLFSGGQWEDIKISVYTPSALDSAIKFAKAYEGESKRKAVIYKEF